MNEFSQEVADLRAQVLARLAVLQRLKEQALAADRAAMFCSIERLIEAETQALLSLRPFKSEAGSQSPIPGTTK